MVGAAVSHRARRRRRDRADHRVFARKAPLPARIFGVSAHADVAAPPRECSVPARLDANARGVCAARQGAVAFGKRAAGA